MDRWQAMRVFVRVAESGGFAEAARQLNMSPPAVTRAVAGIEELIGTRLLNRTTRSVTLTEAGQRYLEDCRRILAEIVEAEAAAAGSYVTPAGTLTVSASILFGQIHVLPILTEFLTAYPAVTGRMVLLDRIANLVDEGIDVAVRIGHLPDSSLSAIRVGTVRRVVCGAPAYFTAHGMPERPADLARHTIIATTGSSASPEWRFGGQAKAGVALRPRLTCNSNEAAISAAISGWGLTRVLSYQIGPALADGRLRIILDSFEEEPLPIHIVHPEGRHASAKVRAFVDHATRRLRASRMIDGDCDRAG
jgi:DNA-binding transcriptional LysR family regulator